METLLKGAYTIFFLEQKFAKKKNTFSKMRFFSRNLVCGVTLKVVSQIRNVRVLFFYKHLQVPPTCYSEQSTSLIGDEGANFIFTRYYDQEEAIYSERCQTHILRRLEPRNNLLRASGFHPKKRHMAPSPLTIHSTTQGTRTDGQDKHRHTQCVFRRLKS